MAITLKVGWCNAAGWAASAQLLSQTPDRAWPWTWHKMWSGERVAARLCSKAQSHPKLRCGGGHRLRRDPALQGGGCSPEQVVPPPEGSPLSSGPSPSRSARSLSSCMAQAVPIRYAIPNLGSKPQPLRQVPCPTAWHNQPSTGHQSLGNPLLILAPSPSHLPDLCPTASHTVPVHQTAKSPKVSPRHEDISSSPRPAGSQAAPPSTNQQRPTLPPTRPPACAPAMRRPASRRRAPPPPARSAPAPAQRAPLLTPPRSLHLQIYHPRQGRELVNPNNRWIETHPALHRIPCMPATRQP